MSGIDTNCMTLLRFIMEEQKKFPTATGDFTQLLSAIVTAVKCVSDAVRKAGIVKLFGLSGETNVQGEEVKKLDVLANELFINMLKSTQKCYALISEENENAIEIGAEEQGNYLVCFDPLDGSSNIDCLGSIGSIFSIYRQGPDSGAANKPLLMAGKEIVAAGYAIYGSATMMVLSFGHGVHGFMLNPSIGEFVLTEPDIKIKDKGNIYSINEGYTKFWDPAVTKFVNSKKFPEKGKPYGARYIGSMVADVHRTFLYGGIFMYPATSESPKGKLRLLYECCPMAFLMEQAGGKASHGSGRILDIVPTSIHQRAPIFLGSKTEVDEIEARYAEVAASPETKV